ncbi:MAG: hypothetical protein NTU61_06525 [Candidatus Altiarchaeota archaeon]|nr:hypothetical protein [Candidatus Altiarchaeota archaeon]
MELNSASFVERYYLVWHPDKRIREESRREAVRELSSIMDYRQVYMAIKHTKVACLVKLKRIWGEFLRQGNLEDRKIMEAVRELEWINEQLGVDEPVTLVKPQKKLAGILAYC